MTGTELGKIVSVRVGNYDGHPGIHYTFSGAGWGVGWSDPLTLEKLDPVLTAAKVNYAHELINKPVSVTMNGNVIESWRILAEVL